MKRRDVLATAGSVGIVAVAGCMEGSSAAKPSNIMTSQSSGIVLSVTEIPQSDVTGASNSTKARFETLTTAQQQEFRSARKSDVRNPTSWRSGTDIEYVYYNGSWYSIQVQIKTNHRISSIRSRAGADQSQRSEVKLTPAKYIPCTERQRRNHHPNRRVLNDHWTVHFVGSQRDRSVATLGAPLVVMDRP